MKIKKIFTPTRGKIIASLIYSIFSLFLFVIDNLALFPIPTFIVNIWTWTFFPIYFLIFLLVFFKIPLLSTTGTFFYDVTFLGKFILLILSLLWVYFLMCIIIWIINKTRGTNDKKN